MSRALNGGHGQCRSCQAAIIWFKSATGKNVPIDASSVQPGDQVLDTSRHISHFATCPDADKFRRKKK
jgi:hypothetical protein